MSVSGAPHDILESGDHGISQSLPTTYIGGLTDTSPLLTPRRFRRITKPAFFEERRGSLRRSIDGDSLSIASRDSLILGHTGTSVTDVSASSHDHCHVPPKESDSSKKARRKLILASVLCLIFMIGEAVGGYVAGSLAVLTDAAHLLTDFASFMISLFSLWIASRPATKRMSFGWYRAEVIGALTSVIMIWVITGILVYEAIQRIRTGEYEIDGKIMLITAGVGVAFNIIMGMTLHDAGGHHHHGHSHGHSHGPADGHSHGSSNGNGQSHAPLDNHSHGVAHGHSDSHHDHSHHAHGHSHGDFESTDDHVHRDHEHHHTEVHGPVEIEVTQTHGHAQAHSHGTNINVRAAFIHVVGDLFQSVGVLIASYIIYYKPEYRIVDPICTFLFSVLVLFTTVQIMRETLTVLMEGLPRGMDFDQVRDSLQKVPGVVRIHNLRIWALTMDKIALSAHLAIDPNAKAQEVLRTALLKLRSEFSIHESTLQIEDYHDLMVNCLGCKEPND